MKIREPNRRTARTAAISLIFILLVGTIGVIGAAHIVKAGSGDAEEITVSIAPGDGLAEIATTLRETGAIRSTALFKTYAVLTGVAHLLKPGSYEVDGSFSLAALVKRIVAGENREIIVTIPEGATAAQIDVLLSGAGVLPRGALIAYARDERPIEGYLFPDTYRFFFDMEVDDVVARMTELFTEKALPLLEQSADINATLVLASILEREVPEYEDRRLVAGLLLKRLDVGMPLQVDASICYIKEVQRGEKCYPLFRSDFAVDSRYNTYIHIGLPPLPISNPGIDAIRAVLDAQDSTYWFYLSDPETRGTIFSETLDEHNRNRVKYLNI